MSQENKLQWFIYFLNAFLYDIPMLGEHNRKSLLISLFLTTCLWVGVTAGYPLLGWEIIKPHPDLKRYSILGIFVLGLVVAWFQCKKKQINFFELEPIRSLTSFFDWPAKISVTLVFLVYFLTQTLSVLALHAGLETALWDFGFYNQIVWNSAHGHSLMTSIRGGLHLFAEHFKPILILLTPIYRFTNNTELFLMITTFVPSTSLIASYLITRHLTKSHKIGLAFMLCVFFYLPIRNGINFPFHSQTFADPFILFGFLLLLHKRDAWSLVFFSLALMCKESVTMDILGLGAFLVATKQRKGWDIVLLAGIFFAFIFFFVTPAFKYPYHFVQKWSFYAHFTTLDPEAWVRLLEPNPIIFLFRCFGPFLFLSVFCKRWYVLFAPSLGLRLLSNYPGLRLVTAHYTAGLNALILISVIYGIVSLLQAERKHPLFSTLKNPGILSALLLFNTFAFSGFAQMLPIDKNLWYASKTDYQQSSRILESIPAGYSVMAAQRLCSRTFKRPDYFTFFEMFPHTPLKTKSSKPDLVILDLERTTGDEHKKLTEFIQMGYKEVFSNKLIKIFDHPEAGSNVTPRLVNEWERLQQTPSVPYRAIARSLAGVFWVVIFGGAIVRLRRKKEPLAVPA